MRSEVGFRTITLQKGLSRERRISELYSNPSKRKDTSKIYSTSFMIKETSSMNKIKIKKVTSSTGQDVRRHTLNSAGGDLS